MKIPHRIRLWPYIPKFCQNETKFWILEEIGVSWKPVYPGSIFVMPGRLYL